MAKIKNIFVDRDGTLIEDKHYLADPSQVCLLPHVTKSLLELQNKGMKIFIVTNQSGIGRNYFSEADFEACQKELYAQLKEYGLEIIDTAHCPHDPNIENCTCRKPNTKMWEDLAEKYNLKAEECAMIGDKKEDVLFGINANFTLSALVSTGKGKQIAEKLNIDQNKSLVELDIKIFTSSNNKTTKCLYVQDFTEFKNYIFEKKYWVCEDEAH